MSLHGPRWRGEASSTQALGRDPQAENETVVVEVARPAIHGPEVALEIGVYGVVVLKREVVEYGRSAGRPGRSRCA